MFDPTEAIALTPAAAALITEIHDATRPSSDGGARITRSERRRILQLAAQLAAQLALDVVD